MKTRPNRRGVAMVAVIACVILLMAVVAVLLRLGSHERHQARSEERRQQAVWLAESGLERARGAIDLDSRYAGETWNVLATEIGGPDPAVVRIEVTSHPDGPEFRAVRSIADYPSEGTRRVRQTLTATFPLKSTSTGDSR